MIGFLKYLIAFALGAIVMAHNPKLISTVTSLTEQGREKIVQLTGKADREVKRQQEITERNKKQLEEIQRKKQEEGE